MSTTAPTQDPGSPEPAGPLVAPLRRASAKRESDTPVFRFLAVAAAAVAMALLAYGAATRGNTTSGLLLVPFAGALLLPIISRLARDESSFDLFGVLYLGFALRIIGSFWRVRLAADAKAYHRYGSELADSFAQFQFAVDPGREVPGTGSVRYFSGLVLLFTGKNYYAEFLVFTMIAFTGTILLYKAFVTAFPNGDRKRYALLVFLWPSLAFWPSSIGKESLMLFGVGLVSYGAARLFTHKPGGALALTGGLLVLVLIRPHVALVALLAVGAAYLFVRSTSGSMVMSGSKLLAIGALLIGGAFIATQTAEFLDLENLGTESVDDAFSFVEDRTSQGGAEFSPIRADGSPVNFPLAVGTVVYRPFPFEAHNFESLVAAMEGFGLIVLTVTSWRRLWRLPAMIIREPYVAYATAMTLLSCFVFSVIGNFGILTRQRTQLVPFFFVLLCIPVASEAVKRIKAEPKKRASLLDSA